jgi:hypothetical protein
VVGVVEMPLHAPLLVHYKSPKQIEVSKTMFTENQMADVRANVSR